MRDARCRAPRSNGQLIPAVNGAAPGFDFNVSPDGARVLTSRFDPDSNRRNIWLLASEFDEDHGRISPDGRRIAYESNESGKFEVYVQAFPALGDKRQVSAKGWKS